MNNRIRKLEVRMIAIFVLVMMVTSLVMMSILSVRSNENLKNYVSDLVSVNGRQIELNIDTYLRKIQKNAALLFADESYITYDKANSDLSDYARIQLETAIEDKILDLSLMENFTDFAIVYNDDSKIGILSKNTTTSYADGGIYDAFSSTIDDELTNDGWSFRSIDEFSRIYYTKRLNEHAIILVSFYGTELDSAFEVPDSLHDMEIYLANPKNQIVYSTAVAEIGETLPEGVTALLGDNGQSLMDDLYLVTSHLCSNGWKVVCAIPSESLMRENRVLFRNTSALVVLLALLGMLIGIGSYLHLSRKMNTVVGEISDQANSDRMTGLLNKMAFTTMVSDELREYTGKQANCFVMVDIDNFKAINDRLGHAKGDMVIIRMAEILKEAFSDDMKIGRIGGDEFAIFACYTRISRDEAERRMRAAIDRMFELFLTSKLQDERERISVSCGVVVAGAGEYTYEQLYNRADKMLYISKQNGKNQATFESRNAEEGGQS